MLFQKMDFSPCFERAFLAFAVIFELQQDAIPAPAERLQRFFIGMKLILVAHDQFGAATPGLNGVAENVVRFF
ncbi:MAG: hypothetical protein H6Q04_3005, partial [Acidobacteria bacterium]|nr:hypothetical protein [Acidobacteriota bacterium]